MPNFIAKRFVLQGTVQGVGCRAQIYELVEQLGHVSGFVRNLKSGDVEVCVKGPDWRINDLESILREKLRSPVRIERLLAEEIADLTSVVNGFVIARDH